MNTVKQGEWLEQIVLQRIQNGKPKNMSDVILKARERHGKPFSYEPGSSWKPHDTPVLTQWMQSKGEMKPFAQWKELRELVRMSAIRFELSPESEKMALDSALRSPVHAFECYTAIERSYEKPTT